MNENGTNPLSRRHADVQFREERKVRTTAAAFGRKGESLTSVCMLARELPLPNGLPLHLFRRCFFLPAAMRCGGSRFMHSSTPSVCASSFFPAHPRSTFPRRSFALHSFSRSLFCVRHRCLSVYTSPRGEFEAVSRPR